MGREDEAGGAGAAELFDRAGYFGHVGVLEQGVGLQVFVGFGVGEFAVGAAPAGAGDAGFGVDDDVFGVD